MYGFASAVDGRPTKFSPILYVSTAADDAEASRIHRLVWSQGVVPILLIATPSELQIRKSLGPPNKKPISVAWQKFDEPGLPPELNSLSAVALTSSIVWNDYVADRSGRVDNALLDAIVSLNKAVTTQFQGLQSEPSLVNSIIGRFIYFFVLFDRGIISTRWIKSLKRRKATLQRDRPIALGRGRS